MNISTLLDFPAVVSLIDEKFLVGVGGGGGGKGEATQHSFIQGCSTLRSNPFITDYWQKQYPFQILSTVKWCPFHIPNIHVAIHELK